MAGIIVVSGREGVFAALNTALDEPVRLFYELGLDRYERRKVEEYRDGAMHSADASGGQGTTFLSWEPPPPQSEIEADPEFRVQEMRAQRKPQLALA